MSVAALLTALLAAAAPAPPVPEPERGVAVVLERVGGTVLVRADGALAYHRLRAAERVPVGATVDAQDGRVRLVAAQDEPGATWRATFWAGKFTVTQPAEGAPVTTLTLTGPTYHETCDATAAATRRKKPKRVRRLWGKGHGRFRTSGHYSAATVRGTHWLTEDRCDGTVTRVLRGTVEVEDFTDAALPPPESTPVPSQPPAPATGSPRSGTTVVPAGGSYVARPGD